MHQIRWLRRGLFWLLGVIIVVEIVYLIAANYVLGTQWLSERINRHPDKLFVQWQSAWTLLPGLVHVDALTVRNTAGKMAWQAQVQTVDAWIDLFPLSKKTFRTHWVDADGLVLWMRAFPDDGYTDNAKSDFLPPLSGPAESHATEVEQKVNSDTEPQLKPPPGWIFAIEGLNVKALPELWIAQYRLTGDVAVETDLRVQVHGPIALRNVRLQVRSAAVTVAGEKLVNELQVDGNVNLDPFDPKIPGGPSPTQLISGHLTIEAHQSDYGFVNYYLGQYEWPRIVGAGNIKAVLHIENGRLLEASTLQLAPVLNVEILNYKVVGTGDFHAKVIAQGEQADMKLLLTDVAFFRQGQPTPHLRSPRLAINATSGPIVLGIDPPRYHMELELARSRVPDVRVFNTYLASDAKFKLLSGQGSLAANLTFAENRVAGNIKLSGDKVGVDTWNRPINGDVAIDIRVRDADLSQRLFDVSGTRIRISDALPKTERRATYKAWSADIKLDEAWLQALDKQRTLDYAFRFPDGIVRLDADVSDIRFINRLIPQSHSVEFRGPAHLHADVDIEAGSLAPGTRLDIRSDRIATKFLDFIVSGKTDLHAQINGKLTAPRGSLRAKMTDIRVRRVLDSKSFVRGASFELNTHARRFDFDKGLSGLKTTIKLGPAEIPDMTVYNSYFPPASDTAILAGRGDLNAQFELYGTRARGQVNLLAEEVVARVQGHTIETDLRVKTRLSDGYISKMQFDLAGTAIILDKVDLLTENDLRDENWWGQIYFEKGDLVWTRPLHVDSRVRLKLRDSGPIVHLFVKKTQTNRMLDRILTIRDITGQADLRVAGDQVELTDMHLTGESLLMLGQLRIAEKKPTGALYAKYKIIGIGVELDDGQHKLRLADPRGWYDQYTGQVGPVDTEEAEDFGD